MSVLAVMGIAAALGGCDSGARSHDHDARVSALDAAAPETGEFHERVRPILEARCGGCHGVSSATFGLVVGGAGITSRQVVAGLVNRASRQAPLDIVEPGDPDASWLVRKVERRTDGVTCSGTCGDGMPPAGAPVTDEELEIIRGWIAAGAEGS